jgi:hypothetical protein
MHIVWTATVDGEPEPRLDAEFRIYEPEFKVFGQPRAAMLRAAECEMHYLGVDLGLALDEVLKGRWDDAAA